MRLDDIGAVRLCCIWFLLSYASAVSRGAWLPICSISALSGGKPMALPSRIEVAGEKLAVWRGIGENDWSVVSDECPHRKAPLSQGRVDLVTNCLECPYHGWQFDTDGNCTKIPQLDTKFNGEVIPGSSAQSRPTHITGGKLRDTALPSSSRPLPSDISLILLFRSISFLSYFYFALFQRYPLGAHASA